MAYSFGDSFDLYAVQADMTAGYWDIAGGNTISLTVGRFAGSRAINPASSSASNMTKISGINDAVHHIVCAFQQTGAITGTNAGFSFVLYDGITAQCSIVFRSDGAILLISGAPNSGTTLATYTGAFPVASTWYAFEFEVVINNTTGAFRVRKNGNSVNDFDSGAVLNTRGGTTNNYANRLQVGSGLGVALATHVIDDLYWRSDAASVPWMGDLRCVARMPATDVQNQFTGNGATRTYVGSSGGGVNQSPNSTTQYYWGSWAAVTGSITSVNVTIGANYTGHFKLALFADNGLNAPGAVIAAASNIITNPAAGTMIFTFTGTNVVTGQRLWLGMAGDALGGSIFAANNNMTGYLGGLPYASFPTANPGVTANAFGTLQSTMFSTLTNAGLLAEAQQDTTTTYVVDSTIGHGDLYGVAAISSTPLSTIAVTSRIFAQKTDAGGRTGAVQLKSGATTVQSPAPSLTASTWTWSWRTDVTDPATSAAWTPSGVANAQIGPIIVT